MVSGAGEPDRGGPLDPFGLTSGAFVRAAVGRGFGPGQAERAYRETFRLGRLEHAARRGGGPVAALSRAAVAPIVLEQAERGPEGVTTKFCQRVPAAAGGPERERGGPHTARPARFPDELDIESVIIPMVGRTGTRTSTLCVSSQIGCAMGCGFCETAQMGLVRSLRAEEIVGQWFAATHAKGAAIDNMVFMGMGEPLDNADEVIRAISVLTDHNGPAVAMQRITVSTVGRVDGLEKLARMVRTHGWHRLGLAVSVNAPNDEIRSRIMPVNRSAPMAELREAVLAFRRGPNRKICFEYVLIPGVNDAREHASELGGYLEPFKARPGKSPTGVVNLIPYNPRRGSPWPAPEERRVDEFMGWLHEAGLFVKRRRTKGRAMMGACGQLGTAEIRGRRYVPLTVAAGTADAV